MKTPKEKAKERVDRFIILKDMREEYNLAYIKSKKCALICINEEDELLERIHKVNPDLPILYALKRELVEIKQEIEKL